MKAYKGFTSDLYSRLGDGKEENCKFKIGETKEVPSSKTARTGFHCCENPFECLTYYNLSGSRFFIVEAEGDIDEDDSERIACTKITLVEEMDALKLAREGMAYIINHQDRAKWEQNYVDCKVARDEAQVSRVEAIAIARGTDPIVKGPRGAIIGILKEGEKELPGCITECKLAIIALEQHDKWLHLNDGGELEVVE